MKDYLPLVVVLLLLGGVFVAYKVWAKTTCTRAAVTYLNNNKEDRNALDMRRLYDLKYEACMGTKGL